MNAFIICAFHSVMAPGVLERIRSENRSRSEEVWALISLGPASNYRVIGDVKEAGLGNPAQEEMYIPLAQVKGSFIELNNKIIPMTWVVKTAVSPLTLSTAVGEQVLAADSQLAIAHERSLDNVVSEATAQQNFNLAPLSLCAGLALLAEIGIYGMLSSSV